MSGAHVFIDRSQFPESVRRDLFESLRARTINHKFHYDSYKQAARWLALHEAHSPARHDASCLRSYDTAFAGAMAEVIKCGRIVRVIGLGCGGGQKEARLLELFRESNCHVACTLSDVSLPLVLTAREAACRIIEGSMCRAAVCDLATVEDIDAVIGAGEGVRLVTLFGLVPNFEPAVLMSKVAHALRRDDLMLMSANLAPGNDYAAGTRKVLPQYDNELTRDWLLTLLLDLGFEREDGILAFSIETRDELHRVVAHFELTRARDIRVMGEEFSFQRGERIRLFFSYRHTPETIRAVVEKHGLAVLGEWINDSGEEGVFLVKRTS
jgi:L-histidine Nalpha-methyltransferase